jgi:hypothetical protein
MSITVKHVNLFSMSAAEEQAIRQVLAESSHATVFHTIEWNRILAVQTGYEDVVLLAYKYGLPIGLYILFVLDSECCYSSLANMNSIYGGPISIHDDPGVIFALLHAAETYKPLSAFHIWSPPRIESSMIASRGYSVREIYQTPLWHLDFSEEQLWNRLDRKKRTQIRKAIREGVSILNGDIAMLDEYNQLVFSILDGASDSRTGEAIQLVSKEFYRQVMETLCPLGMAGLFLTAYKGEYISGSIVLYFKDSVYGWSIGWRREYASLSPNDLMAWQIACHARSAGYKVFDLMVIDPVAQPGIAKWKIGFGVEVVPCHYFHKSTAANRIMRAGKLAITDFPALMRKVLKRKRTPVIEEVSQ